MIKEKTENKEYNSEIKTADLKKMMEENLKLAKENREMLKKIKKYILFSRVWGIIKIVIILTPLILGIIYLPPLMDDVIKNLREYLGINKIEQTMDNFSPR